MNNTYTNKKVDLHMHSTASDGTLSPKEVVRMCKDSGLEVIALTDHDTVNGIDEALQAGKEFGVRVITGSELSVTIDDFEFHMLAYGLDHTNSALKKRLDDFRKSREDRAFTIASKLKEFGFDIDYSDFERVADGAPIGKPHMAKAVLENPKNKGVLQNYHIETFGDFITKFLSDNGLAHVARDKFPVEEVIRLVHEAGGVCVMAHPGWSLRRNFESAREFLTKLKSLGLDGVEVFYSGHSKEQTEVLFEIAHDLELPVTVGSDFHDPNDPIFHSVGTWENFDHEADLDWLLNR